MKRPSYRFSTYMKEDLRKNTQNRDTSVFSQQPIMLVPKHTPFLTQQHQHSLPSVTSQTKVATSFDLGFRFRMTVRSYRPNLERLFPTSPPV